VGGQRGGGFYGQWVETVVSNLSSAGTGFSDFFEAFFGEVVVGLALWGISGSRGTMGSAGATSKLTSW